MHRQCVNLGGAQSLLLFETIPLLEQPVAVPPSLSSALGCWEARPGQIFTVKAPDGRFYRARLQKDVDGTLWMIPFWQFTSSPESHLHITVFQALPEKERFELILEKLTELGVQRIVPFVSSHSITLEERDAVQKKSHRWPHVLLRAAKQSRRGMIPELSPVISFEGALKEASENELGLMLYEGNMGKREGLPVISSCRSVSIVIGPEGGFSQEEAGLAGKIGIETVGLGPRILRTETAAIAATILVQQRFGDLK